MSYPCWLVAGLFLGCATAAHADEAALSPSTLMGHVAVLTDARLEGRRAGSRGEEETARYVSQQLERFSLEPRRQPVPFAGGISVNVYAFIPGRRSDEVIVVGAHLDHLGRHGQNIFPGASDNASGVAVLLGLAQSLTGRRKQLERSVLVVFFGAEEIGLAGSRHFVRDPPVPLGCMKVMVNLDSIGRPLMDPLLFAVPMALMGIDRQRTVGLEGGKSRPGLRALSDVAFAGEGGEVLSAEDLPDIIGSEVARQSRGRSDSESFAAVGVPPLFFSEGESSDYHQLGDTPDRLRPELMAKRAHALLRLVQALSTAPRETFALSAAPPPKRKPPPGWYLPLGLATGVSAHASAGFYTGAEASAVYLARSLFWTGAYADVVRDFAGPGLRISAGPELGFGLIGLDGGYLSEFAHGHSRQGFTLRGLLSLSALSLTGRLGYLSNGQNENLFGEIGLLAKWPIPIVVKSQP